MALFNTITSRLYHELCRGVKVVLAVAGILQTSGPWCSLMRGAALAGALISTMAQGNATAAIRHVQLPIVARPYPTLQPKMPTPARHLFVANMAGLSKSQRWPAGSTSTPTARMSSFVMSQVRVIFIRRTGGKDCCIDARPSAIFTIGHGNICNAWT